MQRSFPSQGYARDIPLKPRHAYAHCTTSQISSREFLAIYCSMLSTHRILNVYVVMLAARKR